MPPATTVQPQTGVTAAVVADGFAPPLTMKVEDLTKIWILFYRHGVNPQCYKGFFHNGDMRSAVDRAKSHCAAMGYRYIFIRPFVVDIDSEERNRGGVTT